MRRSIDDLRSFYGDPKGALVRRILAAQLTDAWGNADNCDVLGIGYATPWLGDFTGARRVIAAMPGGQGAEPWVAAARNRTVLVDDRALPFASGLFDRILLVRSAGLEPRAWSQALYVPPWQPILPFSDGIEQFGRILFPGTAGLLLMEAGRRTYARPTVRGARSIMAPVPALNPASTRASLSPTSALSGHATTSDLAERRKPLYGGPPCTD